MKQTENYGLNQWELADRIRMEDFNGDNEKVDAALKGQAETSTFYPRVSTRFSSFLITGRWGLRILRRW